MQSAPHRTMKSTIKLCRKTTLQWISNLPFISFSIFVKGLKIEKCKRCCFDQLSEFSNLLGNCFWIFVRRLAFFYFKIMEVLQLLNFCNLVPKRRKFSNLVSWTSKSTMLHFVTAPTTFIKPLLLLRLRGPPLLQLITWNTHFFFLTKPIKPKSNNKIISPKIIWRH